MYEKKFNLQEGDRVKLSVTGFSVTGVVKSAYHYGPRDGWYVEITSDAGKYHYLKEGPDQGKVEKLAEKLADAEPGKCGKCEEGYVYDEHSATWVTCECVQ